MTVRLEGNIIRLIGDCHVEDAESLLSLLQTGGARALDLTECTLIHGAAVQVMLAFRPAIAAPSRDHFIANWLCPALSSHDTTPITAAYIPPGPTEADWRRSLTSLEHIGWEPKF